MRSETQVRSYAHQIVDRLDARRLKALLDLLDEDVFSQKEITQLQRLRKSKDWTDWRKVRQDV